MVLLPLITAAVSTITAINKFIQNIISGTLLVNFKSSKQRPIYYSTAYQLLLDPELNTGQNSCKDQIEENLATYVGGRKPPYRTPELGPI